MTQKPIWVCKSCGRFNLVEKQKMAADTAVHKTLNLSVERKMMMSERIFAPGLDRVKLLEARRRLVEVREGIIIQLAHLEEAIDLIDESLDNDTQAKSLKTVLQNLCECAPDEVCDE